MGESRIKFEQYIKLLNVHPAWIARRFGVPLDVVEKKRAWYKLCKSPE
jgi:hypothetical protein